MKDTIEDLVKYDDLWVYKVNTQGEYLSLTNAIRHLITLGDYLKKEKPKEITLEIDLSQLTKISSELITQFVLIHMILVRSDSVLKIKNVSFMFKDIFDIIMFDRIISIVYDNEHFSEPIEAKKENKKK